MMSLLLGIAVAFIAGSLTIPPLMRAAWRWGVLDYPGVRHHVHARVVPRLGGVAVFVGFVAGMGVAAGTSASAPHAVLALFEHDPRAFALLAAGSILFLIGLLDDLKDISPAIKLAGQTVAAAVVCYYGFRVDTLSIPSGIVVHLGWAALPISILWIVGVSNAFNLIDGLDGLAGGVALIALLASALSGQLLGSTTAPWYGLILAAALVAFLRFNRPPARLFLGDSGSLVVGFLIAVLSVKGATRPDGVTYPLLPLFAISYPLLDTGIAILRRWLRGAPLSRADGRHLHHQLVARGFSAPRALGVICLESAGVAALGLGTVFAPPIVALALALSGALLLCAILTIVPRWLEYYEFLELSESLASAARYAAPMLRAGIQAREITQRIRSARTFAELSMLLNRAAHDLQFARISLRPADSQPLDDVVYALDATMWRLEYPIVARGVTGAGAIAVDALLLTLWRRMGDTARPGGAERVARILVPAIERWLAEPGRRVPIEHEVSLKRPPIFSPSISVDVIRPRREPARTSALH